jgi:hypothetical protein
MENVIEFPKQKPEEKETGLTKASSTKKVFNIADWTPDYSVQLNSLNLDSWPFCAA